MSNSPDIRNDETRHDFFAPPSPCLPNGSRVFEKLAPWGPEAAELRRRLRTCYLITAGLDIPGVVRAISLRASEDGLRLSRPWLPASNLEIYANVRRKAATPARLDLQEIYRIAAQLAGILVELEAKGIAHGAIQAEHVLIDEASGAVKLISFGLARFVRAPAAAPESPAVVYTDDLRGLGKLLFWLSTGERTASGQDDQRHSAATRWKPESIAHLPEHFIGVIARLIDAGLPGGYRTAAAAVNDLQACLQDAPATAPSSLGIPADLPLPLHRFGRETQLKALMAAYADAIEGGIPLLEVPEAPGNKPGHNPGYPLLALVDGLSGIGKTAVIQAACQAMRRHGARIAVGKFNQFGDSRPLWALAQALDGVIATLLDADTDERQAARQRIHEALGNLGGVLFDFLPRLQQLIGTQPEPPTVSGEASRIRFELLLSRFVAALATRNAPLVIFMDDIHWADRASLDLVRGLLRNPSIRNLLMIGAYRSEAVSPEHPLTQLIETISADRQDLRQITVNAWSRADITGLMEQTGFVSNATSQQLIELLLETTKGNPFGVLQALREAHAAHAVHFDPPSAGWLVDFPLARAALQGFQPVDLVGKRLAELPPACRELLATGAILGASFDLDALASASRRPFAETLHGIWPALSQGLLLMVDEAMAPGSRLALQSAHDIVQQAAHRQIGQADRSTSHILVGRALLAHYQNTDTLSDHLFEIIQQFNQASPAAIENSERDLLVELNVSAGRKARGSGAAVNALGHYRMALELLAGSALASSPQAGFELTRETAETAYLAADFAQLDKLLESLEQFRLDPVDAARVQELHIQGLLARNRLSEGLSIGEATLKNLGVDLEPLSPPEHWPVVPQLAELDLAPLDNARIDTALRVLVWLTPCAYITSFEMYARIILTMVALARQHPASPLTPISYTNYGLTLCGTGNPEQGFAAGELAIALSQRVGDEPLRCKVWTLVYGFLQHWKQPLANSLPPLLKTVEDCLLCGDQEYLGYASFLYCDKAWSLDQLSSLEGVHSRHSHLVEQFGHDFSWRHCLVWLQTIQSLRGKASSPLRLRGETFDERTDIALMEKASNSFSLFTAHTLMAFLAWHRNDHQEALDECRIAGRYAMTGGATVLAVDHRMLWTICEILHPGEPDTAAYREAQERIGQMLGQLRAWAGLAACNFAHKLSLVEAEQARAGGDVGRAWVLYETAGEQAESGGFIRDRALIAERAGDYYATLGLHDIARERLLAAYEHYLAWGATAVADNLLLRHARLLGSPGLHPRANELPDLALSLSDKINAALNALNADRIVVFLERLPTVMLADRRPDNLPDIAYRPLLDSDSSLPLALLRIVSQRGEPVDLASPTCPAWAAAAYVSRHRSRTALAMPILQLGISIGAIYVEAGQRALPGELLIAALASRLQGIVDELRIAHLSRQLETSALVDAQTGLPNRAALNGMIELALPRRRGEGKLSTLVVALRMRGTDAAIINGIDCSPAILSEASRRLSTYGEGIIAVARIDRLSFGMLIAGWPADAILSNTRRLLDYLEAPYPGELAIDLQVDAGIRLDDGVSQAAALLRDAESALAASPLRGDSDATIFDAARHGQLTDDEILARDLKWALQHDGLRLVFQPIVDMRSNALLGAEALIRWRHPVRGEIRADILVNVAESFGLIRELGRWVIREAIPRIKSWNPLLGTHTVSINASPLELQYPDYAEYFLKIMQQHDLPAGAIAIEITESTSMQDEATTQHNLQTINDAGVILCIDDFGVGTSSLKRLHSIIARRLKIDRDFVEGIIDKPGQRTTIEMIIRLAEALDLDVVCEGVSRIEHVEFLVNHGLVKAQGYYYSKPLELDAMIATVARGYVLPA